MSDVFIKYTNGTSGSFDGWDNFFSYFEVAEISFEVAYAIEVTDDAQTYYRTPDDVVQIYKEHMQQVADDKRQEGSCGVTL